MSITLNLEPRHDPNETLQHGLTERKTITLKGDSSPSTLVLGRGDTTGIFDQTIGESIVQLTFDYTCWSEQSIKATLMKDSERCSVHINGIHCNHQTHPGAFHLHSGDTISLDNLRYEYRIHISPGDDSGFGGLNEPQDINDWLADLNEKPDSLESGEKLHNIFFQAEGEDEVQVENMQTVSVPKSAATRLADEIQCPICLDIIVHPRTVNPCGHSFCAPCVEKLDKCPQCRQSIEFLIPARLIDSLVSHMVAIPNMLNADDVQQYNERKKIPPLEITKPRTNRPKKRPRVGGVSQSISMAYHFPPPPRLPAAYETATSQNSQHRFVPPSYMARVTETTSFSIPGSSEHFHRNRLNRRRHTRQAGHQPLPPPLSQDSGGGTSSADAICID